ncbi:hypothetical protein MTR_5g049110 [Medicago truncatula]|uniref:Uncharacterized protein n=1 Tax=Medicago truncatula TaxID=3880 RepID=A0A072UDS0_MEDTR|nr:hypothetical protein MTR_5g049110 [Medicago truncatula]
MTRPPTVPGTAASNAASASGTATNQTIPTGSTQPSQTSNMAHVIEPVYTLADENVTSQTSQASTSNIMANTTSRGSPAVTAAAQTTQAAGNMFSQRFLNLGNSGRGSYGIPTSSTQTSHTSTLVFPENSNMTIPPLSNQGENISFGRSQQAFIPFGSPQQSLTNASINALRQTMADTNHDMVNMVTQQVTTVINPFIQETNSSYQSISQQMWRIADFLGAPQVRVTPTVRNTNARQREAPVEEQINQVPENQAQEVQPEVPEEPVRIPIMVNRNQNADQVVMQARRNNYEGHNNIANIVEALLAQNGFNTGLHRPNFVSALSEFVLET